MAKRVIKHRRHIEKAPVAEVSTAEIAVDVPASIETPQVIEAPTVEISEVVSGLEARIAEVVDIGGDTIETPTSKQKWWLAVAHSLMSKFHKANKQLGKEQPPKIKALPTRRWWLLAPAVAALVLGVFAFGYFLGHPKAVVIGLGSFALLGGGAWLSWQAIKQRDGGYKLVTAAKLYTGKENTVNICAIWNEIAKKYRPLRIEFVEVENPTGTLIQLTNNNKPYYFNDVRYKSDGKIVESSTPWALPDGSYLSPRKYTIALQMRANERYETYLRSASLFQKISTVAVIGAFCLLSIFFFSIVSAPKG